MKRDVEKGKYLSNVDLKPFTSWNIGGAAEHFYWPLDLNDLQRFLKTLPPNEPLTWFGLGSNSLVSDEGIKGTVIITQGVLKEMTILDKGVVRAEAGVSCAQVARFAAKNNWVGGEFLAGIPGTVGGALYMNAGAFGGETWNHVIAVETINRAGDIKKRDAKEFEFGYRFTKGLAKDEWFIAGYFQLVAGDGNASLEKIRTLLERRAQTQPTSEPSCGSVFRNPPGNFAARLIESAGLKGYRIGGAEVSVKHANFIVNTGNASARDTLALIRHVQKTVAAQAGVELIPEVKLVGHHDA